MQRSPWLLSRAALFSAVAVMAACVLAFGGSLPLGFAPIDDGELIAGSLIVRGTLTQSVALAFGTYDPELYIPLTLLSYRLNALLGMQPWHFHLLNLSLHATNALLLLVLLRALTGRTVAPLLAALAFAMHPVQTEAVVWLSARKDVLMCTGVLTCMLLWVRARTTGWAVLAYAAALLCKPSALLLPAVLPLLPRHRVRPMQMAPFVGVSALLGAVALLGKRHLVEQADVLQSALLVMKGIALSLGKLIFLVPLRATYDHPAAVTLADPLTLLSAALCVLLVACVLLLRRRNPVAAAGLALFLLVLAPAAANARAGLPMLAGDRYVYLPLAGLLLALAALAPSWLEDCSQWRTRSICAAAVVALVATLPFSWRLTATWQSVPALFGRVLAVHPASSPARVTLARSLLADGQPQAAFDLLREGLRYGDDAYLRMGAAEVYAAAGDAQEALRQLDAAEDFGTATADVAYARGALLLQLGEADAARQQLHAALNADASLAEAHVLLARIAQEGGDWPEAERQALAALRLRHSAAAAHDVLASVYAATHRLDRASVHRAAVEALRSE